ncbi:MAG TPA: alkaline phosphatase PhoX [Fibrobacteria bacterium]|nr:alkaline phosphatase PhoX [Fibrobacteria bacterium]
MLGSVVDLAGRPLPGVTVQLKQKRIAAITDGSGVFRLESPLSSDRRVRPEDLFQVEGQKLAFHVLTLRAHVRLTVFDFAGREVARVLDQDLARGLYGLSPLAGMRSQLKIGVYGMRLEIGPRSYYHRIPFIGKKTGAPGLKLVQVPLNQLAKVAATDVDTLLVSKSGYRSVRQEVLVENDTLPGLVLVPDSLISVQTDDPPYLKAIGPGVRITPLLTVGESVPMTGDTLQAFRMGGIPDGLGLYPGDGKTLRLVMNHEITSTESTHALVTGPARQGAYISEYILDKATARVHSGRYAFESAYTLGNISATPGTFSRFCSGFLAGPAQGLSVPIYLTGEESPDSLAFSRSGPQAVAIVNNKATLLSDFGKMAFENIVVVPTLDSNRTVAFALEEGPARESQLYLYVGRKLRDLRTPDPIYENGLAGGKLYVFATTGKRDEGGFTAGTLPGRWVDPLRGRPGSATSSSPASPLASVSAATLQAWSAVSADGKDSSFNFDRIEDGTYDRNAKGVFYFATTGDPRSSRNRLGRIYKLSFDPTDPLSAGNPPKLEIIAQGDSATGFVSPDNIDVTASGKMVICEDFNLAMHRPPAVWMMDIAQRSLAKLAEVDVTAVPAALRPDGLKNAWETSGVIDASAAFGAGAFLINVQAHSVADPAVGTLQEVPKGQNLVQGGQLLLLHTVP